MPLRFVTLESCNGCGHAAPYENVLASVDAANEVFKAAGIQFWIRSYEKRWLPWFDNITKFNCGGVDSRPWSAVRGDVQALFPNAPDNYWHIDHSKNPHFWLKAANTAFSDPHELLVYVKEVVDDPGNEQNCGGFSYANGPDQGRMIMMQGNMMAAPYTFAHELGHYFGLVHSWQWAPTTDPQTNQDFTLVDNWDLVYRPGTSGTNPHLFFSSRAQAAQHPPAALWLIQAPCTVSPSGNNDEVSCWLPGPVGSSYFEYYGTGASQIRGVSFLSANRNAINIMSYGATRADARSSAPGTPATPRACSTSMATAGTTLAGGSRRKWRARLER